MTGSLYRPKLGVPCASGVATPSLYPRLAGCEIRRAPGTRAELRLKDQPRSTRRSRRLPDQETSRPSRSSRLILKPDSDGGDATAFEGAGAVALGGGGEAGDDLPAQAVARDDRFQDQLGGELEDVDVGLVLLAQVLHVRGALALRLLLDLVVVDRVHRCLGAHHR